MQVLHGNCIYVNDRILNKTIPGLNIDSLKSAEGGISFDKMAAISDSIQGLDAFFLKLIKHQWQWEYRILWETNREVKDGIIINCPEAIKYREKVEF